MLLSFEKWEGLGNDFILVREREVESAMAADLVRRLCDRRRGVGGDGVLLVGEDPLAMVVLNADGSRPEMCGNGLRCVAALLAGRAAKQLVIRTDAGDRRARVTWTGPGDALVEVDMGSAEIAVESKHGLGGREIAFGAVSVGNPHAITFEPVDKAGQDELGPRIEKATPGGTNVEFAARTGDNAFDLVVWERGVGYTQACGTGACATAALACRRGLASFDAPVRVRLPGGELLVTVTPSLDLTMLGPARRVFKGAIEV